MTPVIAIPTVCSWECEATTLRPRNGHHRRPDHSAPTCAGAENRRGSIVLGAFRPAQCRSGAIAKRQPRMAAERIALRRRLHRQNVRWNERRKRQRVDHRAPDPDHGSLRSPSLHHLDQHFPVGSDALPGDDLALPEREAVVRAQGLPVRIDDRQLLHRRDKKAACRKISRCADGTNRRPARSSCPGQRSLWLNLASATGWHAWPKCLASC